MFFAFLGVEVLQDYRTCDLYFAAYLKTVGVEFKDHLKVGQKTYFVFESREDFKALKNGYFSGKAQVSALTLTNEVRMFKRLCHL